MQRDGKTFQTIANETGILRTTATKIYRQTNSTVNCTVELDMIFAPGPASRLKGKETGCPVRQQTASILTGEQPWDDLEDSPFPSHISHMRDKIFLRHRLPFSSWFPSKGYHHSFVFQRRQQRRTTRPSAITALPRKMLSIRMGNKSCRRTSPTPRTA